MSQLVRLLQPKYQQAFYILTSWLKDAVCHHIFPHLPKNTADGNIVTETPKCQMFCFTDSFFNGFPLVKTYLQIIYYLKSVCVCVCVCVHTYVYTYGSQALLYALYKQ